jgi:hypothetical protein
MFHVGADMPSRPSLTVVPAWHRPLGGLLFLLVSLPFMGAASPAMEMATPGAAPVPQSVDPAGFGFSAEATGLANTRALQQAFDRGGEITISRPGTYRVAGTAYIGGETAVHFAPGVFLRKEAEAGPFSHVILNKGARTRTYDRNITIDGLQIIVNGVDARTFKDAYGLHGQLAFFYAQDVKITRFRCLDLGPLQYGIQVCTFRDLSIQDVIIKGLKDGVHLGRGNRFTIRDGVFETFDDAIALNGHDYATGNPELGWIENGVIENCHDLAAEKTTGFFCRILAGAWVDWKQGMEVQQSDTVVAEGRMYRVQAKADGTLYTSQTKPTHASGSAQLDGITWGMVQTDVTYTAGVRNVVFRDIFLEKNRTSFSIHFDIGKYSRSYYPGAQVPYQENLLFDHIQSLHGSDAPTSFLFNIATPVDGISVVNSRIGNDQIRFVTNKAMTDYGPTRITFTGCTFTHPGPLDLVVNQVPGKEIVFASSASMEMSPSFRAQVKPGEGTITLGSDLTGLKRP